MTASMACSRASRTSRGRRCTAASSVTASAAWPELGGDKPKRSKFADYAIGYFHIDIAEVRTEQGKLYLFVAIDRTSKLAFVTLEHEANRHTASGFLRALIEAVPYQIHIVLTDNGMQFCHAPR